MLDRQHGRIFFECDGCSQILDTEEKDFNEARRTMVNEGWQARKWGNDWIHSCPDCAK